MYLRLSVTDACDFRCWYCQPEVLMPAPACEPRLAAARILDLVEAIHRSVPLHKIRITGGEPLLRADLPGILSGLRERLPEAELTLTTNGRRLATQAETLRRAGLHRINVSLDSVDPHTFQRITGTDALEAVREGLRAAREAGFSGSKLNAVLLRSGAGAQLEELVRFAARRDMELRFIELMPLGPGAARHPQEYLPAAEALQTLSARGAPAEPLPGSSTAERYRFRRAGRDVVVGFIRSVSHPFCGHCDRLRLDSRGRLRACLRGEDHVDLMALQAESGAQLQEAVRALVHRKRSPRDHWPNLSMTRIGG